MSLISYSASGMPAGLSIDSNTGEITGTPTVDGPFTVTITATAADGSGSGSFIWDVVVDPNAMTLTGSWPATGVIGHAYNVTGTFLDLGGYYVSPVSIDAASGVIPSWMSVVVSGATVTATGTPDKIGVATFTPRATDSSGTPRVAVGPVQSIDVADDPMVLSGTLADNATVGQAYSSTLSVTGYIAAPASIDAASGTIPAWMTASVSGGTATFSGTPTAGGTVTFTPRITDSYSPTPRTGTGAAQSITVAAPTITWTEYDTIAFGYARLAAGGGKFVAVNSGATDVAVSSDGGATWTAHTNSTSAAVSCLLYGGGVFTTLPSGGGTTYSTSTDGSTWTTRTMPLNMNQWVGTYGAGLFVALENTNATGNTGQRIYTSPDAVTWTSRSAPGGILNCNGVTYGNSIFLAVAGSGSLPVMKSSDGITWTTTGATAGAYDIAYGAGKFVAVAFYNAIMYSTNNGSSWTTVTPPAPPSGNKWYRIMYCNGVFIVLHDGFNSQYLESTDGVTWVSKNLPLTQRWPYVTASTDTFLLTTGANKVVAGVT